MNKFKVGDKIRIKDAVSHLTHRGQFPGFMEGMGKLKDKVLTISGFTSLGSIEVEESRYNLHPEWVALAESHNFKKGDKIRIKDEVSCKTHFGMHPYFTDGMDELKDKVLTIRDITSKGYIKVEESGSTLHPEWIEKAAEYGSLEDFTELIFGDTSTSEVDSILEEAQEILEGERESDYGDPVANFTRIAKIASSILDEGITPEQCVVVMMAVKLSREQYKHKRDNLVDLVAYTEIYNRIKEQH